MIITLQHQARYLFYHSTNCQQITFLQLCKFNIQGVGQVFLTSLPNIASYVYYSGYLSCTDDVLKSRYSARLRRIIVLLFNKLSKKHFFSKKNWLCIAFARFRTNLSNLRISQDIYYVRMTYNNNLLTIYGHRANLLNNNTGYLSCTENILIQVVD